MGIIIYSQIDRSVSADELLMGMRILEIGSPKANRCSFVELAHDLLILFADHLLSLLPIAP